MDHPFEHRAHYRGDGFPCHCFVAGTLIRTIDGYRYIEDIRSGDLILSGDGRFRKVLRTFQRPYQGTIHGVHPRVGIEPIWVTSDHPFLVLEDGSEKLIWKQADGLTDSSFLTNIIFDDPQPLESIHVPEIFRGQKAACSHCHKKRIKCSHKSEEYSTKGPKSFKLTPDFLWMIGMYIAEGSSSASYIQFALHKSEIEYVKKLTDLFTSYGYHVGVRKDADLYQGIVLRISSTVLAKWFPHWLGKGCANKKIPAEIFNLPLEQLNWVHQGILDGDNCVLTQAFEQTSSYLALQVAEISLRQGGQPSIRKRSRQDRLDSYILEEPSGLTPFPRKHADKRGFKKVQNRRLSKPMNLAQKEYDGLVFNLEIDQDQTYVVQNIVVHNCPWGFDEDGEHLGSVKEASKLDWLKSRPDMQEPRNDTWLKWVEGNQIANERTDKLLPWLHREFKKGRLLPHTEDGQQSWRMGPHFRYKAEGDWRPEETVTLGGDTLPFASNEPHHSQGSLTVPQLEEMQKHLEEMQKRGKGIDLMQHTVHDLIPKVNDFATWKKAQDRQNLGEVLHRFSDGWTIRRLQNQAEVEDEGNEMGHCMGEPINRYGEEAEQGYKVYASLRDHNNMPHATMELNPSHWRRAGSALDGSDDISTTYPGIPSEGWIPEVGPESYIGDFYGKGDAPPVQKHVDRMSQWLTPNRVPMEWEENPEADLYRENQDFRPTVIPGEGVYASVSKPLYHRWVFSPSKGVTIGTNSDDHPALVKYHQGLGGDINDTDLVHGYAYPIGNGWRLTDYEHQSLDDPYIINQVVRRLNRQDGSLMTAEGSWHTPLNFDRLHYGMPLPQD